MKRETQLLPWLVVLFGFIQILTTNCSKEEDLKEVPVLTTTDAIDITANTATTGGTITSKGRYDILERGVCWSYYPFPSIANNKTTIGTDIDNYKCMLTGLSPSTKYYVRAFATNNAGTAYGNEISFTTKDLTDAIKIIAVTPTTGLIDGQVTNFIVTVSYKLESLQTGTLMIGFNNADQVNISRMLSNSSSIINKGSGQHIFNVAATVKNWGTLGDFIVYVNLSENPIPAIGWKPLAYDLFILIPRH